MEKIISADKQLNNITVSTKNGDHHRVHLKHVTHTNLWFDYVLNEKEKELQQTQILRKEVTKLAATEVVYRFFAGGKFVASFHW